MKRLVLVGGGHAHLSVLELLARQRPAGVEVVLITPSHYQSYSGMLPGLMAGHYRQTQCEIDLRPLAQSANVRLEADHVVGVDADRQCVGMPDGRHIEYDFLSLDIGSEVDLSWLGMAGDKLLPIKPLAKFFETWPQVVVAARQSSDYRLVVVGGGAAGVEAALAAKHVFSRMAPSACVDLVASESGLLAGHAEGVKRRIARFLIKAGVNVYCQRAAGTGQGLLLPDGTVLPADSVVAATGARAPVWTQISNLLCDEHGYIAVNQYHQSLSHSNVFAAGDICARADVVLGRSGVHAVHAGPVLGNNLLAALSGRKMKAYQPKRRSLYLLACGPRYGIASWGSWSAEGEWVWHWKDRIDRRFVARFADSGLQQRPETMEELS